MIRRLCRVLITLSTLAGFTLLLNSASAQLSDTASWNATVQNDFSVIPNITYLRANGAELKVDVYRPRNTDEAVPTFIYYHGGGWVAGSKEANVLRLMPYLLKIGFITRTSSGRKASEAAFKHLGFKVQTRMFS